MPITVKHSKTSAIPDAGDSTLVQPSDWNADHTLTGLGTMAEQNANAVAITGGTISGVTIPASNVTGTLGVANGGTGATTLTGYVKGAGTSAFTASSTIPNTDITGLGTASTRNAGSANGVATLDAGGKVPVSELPAAVLGALSYQGTWNASTNTPTLTSSTGTKGYYYVVSVAGNTNLDGITDWLVGDWAVYNGTVWQKVDNTETVTSVNGQTGAVVLTTTNIAEGTNLYYTDARARASVSAGTGISYVSGTGVITNSAPDQTVAIAGGTGISTSGTYPSFTVTNTAPDQTVVLNAGTGISTSGTYPNFTITNTSPSAGGDVVGPASATDNAVARFNTTTGKLIQNSVTTIDDTGNASGILSQQFSNGTAVTLAAGKFWYNGTTGSWNLGMGNGNITQQVGEELYRYGKASAAINDSPLQLVYKTGVVGASGVITFAPAVAGITRGDDILGCATEPIANNAFGRITTYGIVNNITTNGTAYGETWADNDDIYYNPVTGGLTKTIPTAPNLKLLVGTVINAGSGGSGSFIVKLGVATYLRDLSDVQLASSTGGQLLTYNQTDGYWKNTSLSAGTAISVTPTAGGAITVANTGVTSAVAGTGISVSGATGAVTVTNTAPDQTVAISAGTGISVTGTYPNFTVTNTAPDVPFTYTSTYIPFGQGTTTPNQSANLTFDGTSLTAPVQRASNGIVTNNKTIGTSFTIPSTDNAMSSGPVTLSAGVTVTVSSGSRWVVL